MDKVYQAFLDNLKVVDKKWIDFPEYTKEKYKSKVVSKILDKLNVFIDLNIINKNCCKNFTKTTNEYIKNVLENSGIRIYPSYDLNGNCIVFYYNNCDYDLNNSYDLKDNYYDLKDIKDIGINLLI